MMQER